MSRFRFHKCRSGSPTGLFQQIAWEKRRGIVQLILLFMVIALSALSRPATIDVQAVRPLMHARNTISADLKRAKEESETVDAENANATDEQSEAGLPSRDLASSLPFATLAKSPLARTRSLGHSKGSPRRPGTPVNGSKKSRPTLTLNAKAFSDRLEPPRTAIPMRSRHFLPANATPHLNGKRLARSSHLHTIDADRVRRKMQMESNDVNATPSKSFSGSVTPFVSTPRQTMSASLSTENALVDTADSALSEYDLASASEAEVELDMQGGLTL
jgi:hypothetical protein